jgi:hypothetical protein
MGGAPAPSTCPAGWKGRDRVLERGRWTGRYLAGRPTTLRRTSPLLFSPTTAQNRRSSRSTASRTPSACTARCAEDAAPSPTGCQRIATAVLEADAGPALTIAYHFLYAFADEGQGSGLEHSFSTLILESTGTAIDEHARSFWDRHRARSTSTCGAPERIHVQGRSTIRT